MPIGTGAALLLSAGISAGTGVAGALTNMSANDRANLLQQQGVQEWLKLNIPDPEEQKIALDQFVQVGKLTPALEQSVKAAEPEIMKFAQDPSLKAARLRALNGLEQQGFGGEQVQDTAAREKAMIESGAQNRGEQEAILGSMARRGQLGSGLELSARLGASQGNQDRNAKNALDLETARRTRALQAIEGAGDLAGDISNQDFGQAATKSAAKSAIEQFNTSNLQGVLDRNTDRTNTANAANLAQEQKTKDLNTTTSNYEQQYNKELLQKYYDNQAKRAAGISGQYNNQADTATAQGQSAANMWGAIGKGLSGAAAGAATLPVKNKSADVTPDLYSDNDEEWGQYVS